MKKYLPVILVFAGILVLVGAFFLVKNKKKGSVLNEDESALIDVSLKDRPVASLTPTEDGHYLVLKVEKIVIDAESMDYELLYETGAGITQGVPGVYDLKGSDSFEAELLLGSESSGKFRYDEGVEMGSLSLKFRNEKGKLMAKFTTDFHLQGDTKELTSVDEKFAYTLDKTPKTGFFVTMETFGIPDDAPGELVTSPYGIFSSADSGLSGEVSDGITHIWTGSTWKELKGNESSDIGVFVGVEE